MKKPTTTGHLTERRHQILCFEEVPVEVEEAEQDHLCEESREEVGLSL